VLVVCGKVEIGSRKIPDAVEFEKNMRGVAFDLGVADLGRGRSWAWVVVRFSFGFSCFFFPLEWLVKCGLWNEQSKKERQGKLEKKWERNKKRKKSGFFQKISKKSRFSLHRPNPFSLEKMRLLCKNQFVWKVPI
jgi:hypothetical protein